MALEMENVVVLRISIQRFNSVKACAIKQINARNNRSCYLCSKLVLFHHSCFFLILYICQLGVARMVERKVVILPSLGFKSHFVTCLLSS
jgi:hypothetical protein